MQILTAAVKMLRSNPTQIFLLFKYVVDLCRYDLNYDLRDKARMLRRLLIHAETGECRLTAPTPVSASASSGNRCGGDFAQKAFAAGPLGGAAVRRYGGDEQVTSISAMSYARIAGSGRAMIVMSPLTALLGSAADGLHLG